MATSARVWRALACNIKELRLDITLACGQSFRWKEITPGEWTSVLRGRIWTLKQDEEFIFYKVIEPETCSTLEPIKAKQKATKNTKSKTLKRSHERNTKDVTDSLKLCGDGDTKKMKVEPGEQIEGENGDHGNVEYETILRDYFQLQYNLGDLYDKWSSADDNFRQVAHTFSGVRMLRQDPIENLFSFICSSNNHISRISGMVERLCETYGPLVGETGGCAFYAFPGLETLADVGVESKLRELGFGYRAKFVRESARSISEKGGESWLHSLRERPYEEAKAELMTLCGVGAKVADCVCLMSLDQLGAIPVDTHVWQIAARHYISTLNSAKSLTPTIYKHIGDHFRDLWGELAGWAHSVLFSADLKKFQDLKGAATKVKKEKTNKKVKEDTKNPDVKSEMSEVSPRKRQRATSKPKVVKRAKR